MYKHPELFDENRDFIIRLCILVANASLVIPGSVIKKCDECDRDVWYDENQKPPIVPGLNPEREFIFCTTCGLMYMNADPNARMVGEPPTT